MIYWVMYDITENKVRNKVVKMLKNKGLMRVQKSIFIGEMNKNQKDELKIFLEMETSDVTDSVFIFPTSRDYLYDTDLIGNGFDKELVANETISKFI